MVEHSDSSLNEEGNRTTDELVMELSWPTYVASSVEEFIALVFAYSSTNVSIEPDYLNLYRGQSSIEWPLLPKLYREPGKRSLEYRNIEEVSLMRFRRLSFPYRDWHSDGAWHVEWLDLFVAHHYGLVTRLLDWTSNPLAALWFVVSDSEDAKMKDDGVVYCLNTENYDIGLADFIREGSPFDATANGLHVFAAPGISERITAQDSYFTSHSCDQMTGEPELIETAFDDEQRMMRIQIPRSSFTKMRHQLNQLSVNESRVYPDLAGVARHVNWIELK